MCNLKGVYVLVISVPRDTILTVGALGKIRFRKGFYAYVGSAQNNLDKRIGRHLRKNKCKFWHIDYLLDDVTVKVLKVFYKEGRNLEECSIAKKMGQGSVLVEGFGSSDCKCKSHLFKVNNYQFLKTFMFEK
jgi:Uri superfamily endonuclease